jgi:protoporphyrinogen IX oxidase
VDYYRQILAIHLLAVIVFGSGLLLTAFMLPSLAKQGAAKDPHAAELRRLRAWALYATTPALCLVWLAGATLAIKGGWFDASWLQIKLCFVAALTCLHGFQLYWMGQLRRGRTPLRVSGWLGPGVAVLLLAIVILAGAKPV